MVLYYTLTKYQQLASILHKILYKKQEEAHLYLSNGNYIEPEYLSRLRESGFFSEVIVMNDQPAWEMGSGVNFQNEDKLYPVLDNIRNLCFSSLMNPIEDYDDIYILADHFPLGYILAYKKIPYHYVEEAAGVHCCYELWMKKILEQKNQFLYLIGKNVGVYGSSDCVIDCLVDIDRQDETYNNEKAVDFSISKLLAKIDDESLKKILYIFKINEVYSIAQGKKVALILTEYLAGSKVCTWEEQRLLYGMFIDYFCNDMEIFIKPHPNDHQGIYKEWFHQITQLEKEAPSELIPYCVDKRFDRIISLASTSYVSLEGFADRVFSFRNHDLRTEKLFRNMNLYYVAVSFIKNIKEKYCVYGIGADTLQIKHLFESMEISGIEVIELDNCDIPERQCRRVIFFDDIGYASGVDEFKVQNLIQGARANDVFIFLDSCNDVLFYEDENNEWVEKTVPVKIIEKPLTKNNDERVRWIYMITGDDNLRKVFLKTRIEKMLVNSGLKIEVNNDNLSIKERVLEGMLYATEQKCILLTKRK